MSARAIMVLGTSSGAGKSWLTTALCRWYARQGLKVAPFKAQNMSNNARVVPGMEPGAIGEIGSAQYFQALAARAVPDVRMNPVLLKPEHDTASQVVVMGQVRRDYGLMPWRTRSELLWPHAQAALQSLMNEYELVVMEGAGSPAEINLHAQDFVNMRSALAAQAACLVVTDIDRGGAFAHLYGTHQLLPAHERALVKGFVLNKFRGDEALLAPGPQQLQDLTGVPTLAVIPMQRHHGLPEEDGLHEADALASAAGALPASGICRIAIVAYPCISNLDEFQSLRNLPGVRLSWARQPRDLDGAHWIILPGSKHTRADLAWLHEQGLADTIRAHAAQGRAVLGICGGLQMLGRSVQDPDGVEGGLTADELPRHMNGLDLLPLVTRFGAAKSLRVTQAQFSSSVQVPGVLWSHLQGLRLQGYEIHQGQTTWVDRARPADAQMIDEDGAAVGWQRGAVLGLYLHGLFESSSVLQALFGQSARTLDNVFDGLADTVASQFAPGALMALLRP